MTSDRILTSNLLWTFPALDNFEDLVTRLTRYFEGDRKMVLMERFVNVNGPDELSVYRNLFLDTDQGHDPNPITTHFNEDHAGFLVKLAPGLHRVGFGTGLKRASHGRVRWDKRTETNYYSTDTIVQVKIEGSGSSNEDSIEIEKWNQHGVGFISTLIFL